jgi:DNA-binding CsgD family transcriptional regulator
MASWPLAYTALGRGDLETAKAQLAAAETFGERSESPDMALAAEWGMAELSMVIGDSADAVARTEAALALARETGERGRFAPFVVTGMRARIAAGRPADAERWLAEVSVLLRPVDWYAAPALDHAAGLLRLFTGSVSAARDLLERAVSGWDSRPRVWEGTWARLDLAGCLMRSGRFADAAGLIAEARDTADRLGSQPLLQRIDELSRLNRGRGAEAATWHPLTAREYEVARLIATGQTNAEIAVALTVAPKTVSAHVEHILAKLGAARRAEIATWVATTLPPAPAPRAAPAVLAEAVAHRT